MPLQASLIQSLTFAVTCTPACQNVGTCHGNSSYTYCDCPKNYTGPHCENRGTATHNQTAGGPGNIHVVVSCLQSVVQPVRMEEYVVVHLPMLTVTVPVGTRDPTARPEVCIAAHTTMQHRSSCSATHTRTYVHLFHTADCIPVHSHAAQPWNMHLCTYVRMFPICRL